MPSALASRSTVLAVRSQARALAIDIPAESTCNLGVNLTRTDAARAIVMLLGDSWVGMIEQGAGKVRRVSAICRCGRSCGSAKKVWRDTDTQSLKGNLRYQIAKSNSGNWSASWRGSSPGSPMSAWTICRNYRTATAMTGSPQLSDMSASSAQLHCTPGSADRLK